MMTCSSSRTDFVSASMVVEMIFTERHTYIMSCVCFENKSFSRNRGTVPISNPIFKTRKTAHHCCVHVPLALSIFANHNVPPSCCPSLPPLLYQKQQIVRRAKSLEFIWENISYAWRRTICCCCVVRWLVLLLVLISSVLAWLLRWFSQNDIPILCHLSLVSPFLRWMLDRSSRSTPAHSFSKA